MTNIHRVAIVISLYYWDNYCNYPVSVSDNDSLFITNYRLLLLLLAAPSWCRCGRHNSPPASSATDFISWCRASSQASVDTAHLSLTRSSSFSTDMWHHLQNMSSDVLDLFLQHIRSISHHRPKVLNIHGRRQLHWRHQSAPQCIAIVFFISIGPT